MKIPLLWTSQAQQHINMALPLVWYIGREGEIFGSTKVQGLRTSLLWLRSLKYSMRNLGRKDLAGTVDKLLSIFTAGMTFIQALDIDSPGFSSQLVKTDGKDIMIEFADENILADIRARGPMRRMFICRTGELVWQCSIASIEFISATFEESLKIKPDYDIHLEMSIRSFAILKENYYKMAQSKGWRITHLEKTYSEASAEQEIYH
jgi:hypothetical protein